MSTLLGPILHFEEATPSTWTFRVSVLSTGPAPVITVEGGTICKPDVVADFRDFDRGKLWQAIITVRRPQKAGTITYHVDDTDFEVHIPAVGQLPRVVFASCAGWSSPAAMKRIDAPDGLVEHLISASGDDVAHVIIGGGDQVYADSLWHGEDEELHDFSVSSRSRRKKKSAQPEDEKTVDERRIRLGKAWVDLYRRSWWGRQDGEFKRFRPMAEVVARVPGLYTWDDHDLMDGWGSFPDEFMSSRVVQAAGRAAARTFRAFQMGVDPEPDRAHHFQTASLGDGLEVVMLDTRWQRTMTRIVGDDQWRALKEHLVGLRAKYGGPHHLLVVVPVPVVHARFPRTMHALLSKHELGDDLRDHWEHDSHEGERSRLIATLLEHAECSRSVTLLSGDVHVATRAYIEAENGARIHQVTSSGIIHPAPTWWEFMALSALGDTSPRGGGGEPLTRFVDITTQGPMLRARNYVDIGFDRRLGKGWRMWVRWFGEVGDGTGVVEALPRQLVVPLPGPTAPK
jgi:hypothetical protein